ncbi:MAG: hypothetical protein HXK46_05325, partial [Atopobium sp.]|nr:hypothetical protein [Atopobium sp.]
PLGSLPSPNVALALRIQAKIAKESVDLPDFAKESVAQIQILCTFQAHPAKSRRVWRETRALAATLALAPGEKPVCSQLRSHSHLARNPRAWRIVWSMAAGESRSPKAISAFVNLLHKIFTYRKDELVKDLPAT